MTTYYPDNYLNLVCGHLGLRGGRCNKTYADMVETWINPLEVIPSEADCKTIYETEIKPIVEAEIQQRHFDMARQQGYIEAGADIGSLITALWELLVENRPEAANMIQAKRLKVKQAIPKPRV